MSDGPAVRVEVEEGVARVVLDVPGASMNVLSVDVLEQLDEAVARAAGTSGVRAVVLRGGKESGFCAGADVDGIAACRDRAEGARIATLGQEVYARIERAPVPIVAAVHGPCLGGGLELALACRGVIASHEPKTRLGLPEVLLGIVPGFGGTQRLSRRVGVARSLDLILTGRMLTAKRALSAGVVDDIVCPFELDAEARRYALALAGGSPRRNEQRREGWRRWLDRAPLRGMVLEKARRDVLRRTRGVFPAPLRAIDLIGRAFEPDRIGAYRDEAAAVGELLELDVTHHLVELFQRREALRKRAGDTVGVGPDDVALVVGAGVMGAAIARAFLKKRVPTRLVDVSAEALRSGAASIAKAYAADVRRGRRSRHDADRELDRLRPGVGMDAVGRATLAVEVVVEREDVKADVFRRLEAALPPDAPLLTNTSSIPITRIAGAVERPGRVVGLHFFNPVERMPLVEVVVGERSDEAQVRRAVALARDLGKVPVVVKDSPGFLVNRVLAPYLAEALLLLEDGVPPEGIDDAMRDLGFAMGPLRVLDTVGLDVAGHVAESLAPLFEGRAGAPRIGEVLVERGELGEKTGRGLFVKKRGRRRPAPGLERRLEEARRRRGRGTVAVPDADVRDRLFLVMLAEAARAFAEGIVDDPRDFDAAMVFGTGFPPNLGGPLRELDRRGADAVVQRLNDLAERLGPRLRPGDDLVRRAGSAAPFHAL